MADQLISPIPDNAPELPKRRSIPVKDGDKITGWLNYDITHYWPYHSRAGEILGYTVRYETPEGKQVLPLTLWQCGEKLKWKFRGFPEPRPLYNQHLLAHFPDAKALIVEGEKCAEVLTILLKDADRIHKLTPVTWMGGCGGVYKADWSLLNGRDIILWPDNDEPGKTAMLQIAGILKQKELSVNVGVSL